VANPIPSALEVIGRLLPLGDGVKDLLGAWQGCGKIGWNE
jgi:hypothetical protein